MKNIKQQTDAPQVKTDCNQLALEFPELISRIVVVQTNDHHVTSDAGALLLAQVDRNEKLIEDFAAGCFIDHRDPDWVEHPLKKLLRQRIYGIALGYEDVNDHESLKFDPLIAALCGVDDVEGEHRLHEADQGNPLAGKSTLNRLELSAQETDGRYRKIQCCPEAIEDWFIEHFVQSVPRKRSRVVLDIDTTNDSIHGDQEGRFFHGYYDEYCFKPLYIFCGDFPVVAALRTSESEHLEDTLRLIEKITAALRKRFGRRLEIVIRGDNEFCRQEIMLACEALKIRYVLGLRNNEVLHREIQPTLRRARRQMEFNGTEGERLYRDFRYKAKDWSGYKRRVIGKGEWNLRGANPRFIITNVPRSEIEAGELYEKVYCARGDMENRIKEQQLDLLADRTSAHHLKSNQLRLWFSTMAYLMIHRLRELVLAGTELAGATCGTIRLKLFKIGAQVKTSCRRVLITLSKSYPLSALWEEAARRLLGLRV